MVPAQDLEYSVNGLTGSYRYDVVVEAVGGNWSGDVRSLCGLAVTVPPINPNYNVPRGTFDFVQGPPVSGSGNRYVYTPAANVIATTNFEKFFVYDNEIYPDKDRFLWYMQAGFNNTNARDHVSSFRLFNLTNKVEIPLDYGNTNFGSGTGTWPAYKTTEDYDVLTNLITSGDFKVAKLSKSGNWSGFLLDLNLAIKISSPVRIRNNHRPAITYRWSKPNLSKQGLPFQV